MDTFKTIQGVLITLGIGVVTAGVEVLEHTDADWQIIVKGVVMVLVGAGIIFWRESRKNTTETTVGGGVENG